MKNYIKIVEAANKGCPVATHDLDLNLKNRQKAIDKYHYGPANPNEPESYWKDAAKRWNIKEKTAKTMRCSNCAAFDVSDKMLQCIKDGIQNGDKNVDAMTSIEKSNLGYCNFLNFKCAGDRSCHAWIVSSSISPNAVSENITEEGYKGNLGISELTRLFIQHPELKPKFLKIKQKHGIEKAFMWAAEQLGVKLQPIISKEQGVAEQTFHGDMMRRVYDKYRKPANPAEIKQVFKFLLNQYNEMSIEPEDWENDLDAVKDSIAKLKQLGNKANYFDLADALYSYDTDFREMMIDFSQEELNPNLVDTLLNDVFFGAKQTIGRADMGNYKIDLSKLDRPGVAEGVPQPGPSSGAPKQFGADAKIQTRQMTVKDIISSVPGVPYYNNVVDDWDAKNYSWGVTKKVIEYATYLKDHPTSLSQLPPVIVLNGKFEDGAHRVSAIWLLQQRMNPENALWKNAKLNVQFVEQEDVEEMVKKDVTELNCPHCGGELVSEEFINEKKDACYYKVKNRVKVWPSAYASGQLVQCRKRGAGNWGKGSKK